MTPPTKATIRNFFDPITNDFIQEFSKLDVKYKDYSFNVSRSDDYYCVSITGHTGAYRSEIVLSFKCQLNTVSDMVFFANDFIHHIFREKGFGHRLQKIKLDFCRHFGYKRAMCISVQGQYSEEHTLENTGWTPLYVVQNTANYLTFWMIEFDNE